MALRALPDPDGNPQPDQPMTWSCPVCKGKMELVYDRHHQQVVVCVECQSGLTIPGTALEIARLKRQNSG